MAEALSKRDVKDAIREAMDDVTVTYSQGAGAFLDSVMRSASDVVDAFDAFFTQNLIEDRPVVARLFVDLRLRSARRLQETLGAKIRYLQAEQRKLAGRPRSARRRAGKKQRR